MNEEILKHLTPESAAILAAFITRLIGMRKLLVEDYVRVAIDDHKQWSWIRKAPLVLPDFGAMTDEELLEKYRRLIACSSQPMG